MADPRKHHYVPEFFIRRWAADEDDVWCYRRPHEAIDRKRKPPSAIGFEVDLYALQGGDPADRQSIESRFMQQLDSRAALALKEVVAVGGRPASPIMASDWARFVMSLISRSPARVREISAIAEAREYRGEGDSLEARYQATRGDDWPATVADYLSSTRDRRFDEDLGRMVVKRLCDAPRMGELIVNMEWGVRDLTDPGLTLLLSDQPVTFGSFSTPNGVIVMPLGPRSIFIAHRSPERMPLMMMIPEQTFVETLNRKVVEQARSVVIASDRSHETLIEEHFPKNAVQPAEGEPSR